MDKTDTLSKRVSGDVIRYECDLCDYKETVYGDDYFDKRSMTKKEQGVSDYKSGARKRNGYGI